MRGAGGWARAGDLLRQPLSYWLCFIYAVTFGGFAGLCSFLPIFFHDQYGLGAVMAGTLTAVCGLTGSLIRPLGGHIADRVGGRVVLAWVLPAIAGFIAAASMLPPLEWALPVLVAAVGCMGFGNGVVFQVVSDHYSKQMGLASGLVGAAGGLGGFLLPAWLGALTDMTGTYQAGFLLFAVLAGVAWASVFVIGRRFRTS